MATTPSVFIEYDLSPDPHNALYSPRVLGRNGNYVNFINDTSKFDGTWLMNTNNKTGESGNFDDHLYDMQEAEVGHERFGWLYSFYIGWIFVATFPTDYNIQEEVDFCAVWFTGQIDANEANMGWWYIIRENITPGTYTLENGVDYHIDFVVYSFFYEKTFGVSRNSQNGVISFINIDTGEVFEYSSIESGSIVDTGEIVRTNISIPEFEITPEPSSGNIRPEGFQQSNLICCGNNNDIMYSRRCSIINGSYNIISPFPSSSYENNSNYSHHGQYNSHIIGGSFSYYTYYSYSNRLHVYCENGMHVISGDVVSDRLSDSNLKDNKVKIKNATKKLNKIKNVSFKWNNKQETYSGMDIGFIAQNIEKLIPEAVQNRKNGFKAVQYQKIIPLVVASIKEKQKRIETLKQKIESLKNGKL